MEETGIGVAAAWVMRGGAVDEGWGGVGEAKAWLVVTAVHEAEAWRRGKGGEGREKIRRRGEGV